MKRHHFFFIISAVTLGIFLASIIPLSAQDGQDAQGQAGQGGTAQDGEQGGQAQTTPSAEPPKEVECSFYVDTRTGNKEIKEAIKEETLGFGGFMTTHFQNEADTSLLLPQAIQRYKIYALTLLNFIDQIDAAKAPEKEQGNREAIRNACKKFINDVLFAQKEVFKMHVLTNAQGKKATKLVDKYKEINDKLEKLNFQVAQMYGYFLSFSNKLPCYATKCN